MTRLLRWMALLIVASSPASAQDSVPASASVFATVVQSEYCATGTVFVDLQTGDYLLTPAATRRSCNDPALARPVARGKLTPEQIEQVREAHRGAVHEGLTVPECEVYPPRPRIVISNGGPQVLVVTSGPHTLVARENLGCWTAAAERLHDVLDSIFRPVR